MPTQQPLILTVKNVWTEGATEETVAAALQRTQKTAMEVDGVICFQYAMDVENRRNHLTEIYRDAGVIGGFFGAMGMGEDGKPKEDGALYQLGSVTTNAGVENAVTACGPKAQVDGAAAALGQFGPACYYSDGPGDGCSCPDGAPAEPLIMTVSNVWNEGQTEESIAALLKEVQAKALSVDGVMCFQYAMDVENKKNHLTEVYRDASVIGAFFGAMGMGPDGKPTEGALIAKLGAATTNPPGSVTICGPKAQVDAAMQGLGAFGPTTYVSDAAGPGCKGF